jgi:hypothetical protein
MPDDAEWERLQAFREEMERRGVPWYAINRLTRRGITSVDQVARMRDWDLEVMGRKLAAYVRKAVPYAPGTKTCPCCGGTGVVPETRESSESSESVNGPTI